MKRARRAGASGARPLPECDGAPIARYWLAALLIAAAVFGLYWGTWTHEFVSFDDRKYIYENPLVVEDSGLAAIWADIANQNPRTHYYPLTFSTFWLEHALVGLGPDPEVVPGSIGRPAHPLYHVTQAAFHAINAGLLLFLLRALGVAFVPSVVVAAIWAVHPVGVASVAWVAERKNLVSCCFGLLSLLSYAHSRRRALQGKASGATPLYLLSVSLFALALTGKAAAMTLAAVVVATDRLLAGRWQRGVILRALPFFALAAAAAYVVAMREAHITVSIEPVPLGLRPLIAVAALVHYVATVFFPYDQAIIYPRWEESFAVARYWWSLAFAAAAVFLAWRNRSRLGEHWFWGVALFVITVSPVLGFKHFAWMQFAFVSDHYLYLGSAGILLAAVLGLERWRRARDGRAGEPRLATGRSTRVAFAVLALAALVFCSWRTLQLSRTWQNNVTLWEHTLKISPRADVPLVNLGNHYYRRQDYATALRYYAEWARVSPQFVRAKLNSARCLERLGRHDEALEYFEAAIDTAQGRPAMQASVRRDYARYLIERRRFEAALQQFEIFLQTQPAAREEIERIMAVLEAQLERDRAASGEASARPE